jgi:hypothetical protein
MRLAALVFGLLLVGPSTASPASEIPWYVWGSGATGGTSASYFVASTLGQNVIGFSGDGASASSTHLIHAGFWLFLAVPPTGIAEDPTSTVPSRFHLYTSNPNPFDPRTTIAYDVPASGGDVRLVVFGVNGRLVRTLVDGHQSSGRKEVTWEGRDDFGRPVASGIYFVKMDAPGYQHTHKVVLQR